MAKVDQNQEASDLMTVTHLPAAKPQLQEHLPASDVCAAASTCQGSRVSFRHHASRFLRSSNFGKPMKNTHHPGELDQRV